MGVSKDASRRFKDHKRSGRVPSNTFLTILFEGTREECFSLEHKLRPTKSIGWNNAPGGSHGWRIGFKHSRKTRRKLKSAWTSSRKEEASKKRKETNQKLRGQKRPKQSEAMKGRRNPCFGKKRPSYVIEAMRKASLGRTPHNKQENYCIGCKERVSISCLLKYHKKCFESWSN